MQSHLHPLTAKKICNVLYVNLAWQIIWFPLKPSQYEVLCICSLQKIVVPWRYVYLDLRTCSDWTLWI